MDESADGGHVPNSALALFCNSGDPDMAQLAVRAGISTVILDAEHGFAIDSRLSSTIFSTAVAGGACFVRVPVWRAKDVPPLADNGLSGVVFSSVADVASLERALGGLAFPPVGNRSINPFVAASSTPGDEVTLRRSSRQFAVWAMAETRTFVEDLASLGQLSATSLVGLIIGPYDLSAQLGCGQSPDDETLLDAVRAIVSSCRESGLQFGLFVRDVRQLTQWASVNIHPDFVILGYDRDVWFRECRRRVEEIELVMHDRDSSA